MRVIFAGTPEFAAHILQELFDCGIEIVAVLTQPDKPKGRGLKLTQSPVKEVAKKFQIPVLQPNSLKDNEVVGKIQHYSPDLMVVAAYGMIIPKILLDLPRYGCINVHASLLPRWRGAAPIHRAIEAGDKSTGISIMQMDQGLDTGAVLMSEEIVIEKRETTGSLHDKLQALGAELCIKVIASIVDLSAISQPEAGVTYAHKIQKSEAMIDWQEEAVVIDRKVRAFDPFPVARTLLNGQEIKIWQAQVLELACSELPGSVIAVSKQGIQVATSKNVLLLEQIQKLGSKRMWVKDFIQGYPISVGSVLG